MVESKKNRIQELREQDLKPGDKKLLENIEKYDCHIIHVTDDQHGPSWSYTIGLFEVFREPEIIVVGLKTDTAQNLLNEISSRLKRGLHISHGLRQTELLANVECEFRRVEDRPELRRVLGYASWFYGGASFPIFQCVYPDVENRFPWEESFDATWRSRQPLLFAGAPATALEEDFWASHDPASSLYDWKFSDPPHTGVYTTKRIMDGEDPITYVCHDEEDGAWQFHGPSESSPESATLLCFHHIVDKDPTIGDLVDLPKGWCAWRSTPAEPWIRQLKAAEESSS